MDDMGAGMRVVREKVYEVGKGENRDGGREGEEEGVGSSGKNGVVPFERSGDRIGRAGFQWLGFIGVI